VVPDQRVTRNRAVGVLGALVIVVGIVVVAVNARRGAVGVRIKNPAVTGAPRPLAPLWGFTHWLALMQIGTIVAMVALVVAVMVG
jgi:hypothetical protein